MTAWVCNNAACTHACAAEPSSWTLTTWMSGARLACATAAAATTPPASQPSPGAQHWCSGLCARQSSGCADTSSTGRRGSCAALPYNACLYRVLEDEPGDLAARSHRAYSFRKLQDYPAAVADYTVALAGQRRGPADVRLYNNRGALDDLGCRSLLALEIQCPRCRAPLARGTLHMSMSRRLHGSKHCAGHGSVSS